MRSLNAQKIVNTEMTPDFEQTSAETVLRWALDKFSPRIALACSFQAEESVLIDMMHRLRGSDFRIFTLDTGRLNQETYDCMDAIRERYGISVDVYFPEAAKVQDMVGAHGLNLFYNSIEQRKLCCAVRKVEPLNRALKNLDAWMTGLRREQAVTRGTVSKMEVDKDHGGTIKIKSTGRLELRRRLELHPRKQRPVQPAAQARLSEYRLRPLHAGGEGGRRSARRALVVGKSQNQRVWLALNQSRGFPVMIHATREIRSGHKRDSRAPRVVRTWLSGLSYCIFDISQFGNLGAASSGLNDIEEMQICLEGATSAGKRVRRWTRFDGRYRPVGAYSKKISRTDFARFETRGVRSQQAGDKRRLSFSPASESDYVGGNLSFVRRCDRPVTLRVPEVLRRMR
jgi:phosphoadenylyl-sulfate reductase (thioredoxin)